MSAQQENVLIFFQKFYFYKKKVFKNLDTNIGCSAIISNKSKKKKMKVSF